MAGARALIQVRKPPVEAQFSLHLPQVKGKCRWCGDPVNEPGRKVWHSACEEEFRIIIDPGYARVALERRDRGICSGCGEDWSQRFRFRKGSEYHDHTDVIWISLWHNDHKIPLHRAKDLEPLQRLEYFNLANMVTLCEPCHLQKTADEATERAHINRLEERRVDAEENISGKVDLTGHHFGKLTVLEKSHIDIRGQTYWRAVCSCGNETVVRGAHLKHGKTRSCGCGKPLSDLIGSRFCRLLVQSRADNRDGKTTWLCLCDCGNEITVPAARLQAGGTKSCGCLAKEYRKGNQARRSHGHAGANRSRAYNSWSGMFQRCENPNCEKYPDYGGRGIIVCKRWQTFENFYADMGDPPVGHTLDRRNNDGNYEPGNCRWATVKVQQNNRRVSKPQWPSRPMGRKDQRRAKDINDD